MTRFQVLILSALGIAAVAIVFAAGFAVTWLIMSRSPSATVSRAAPLATATPTPDVPPTATLTAKEILDNWGEVDIRDLLKNPDRYKGAELQYDGEVFTIQEDSEGAFMQVWVDIPGGDDREVIVVLYEGDTEGIYEGTKISILGRGLGTFEGTNSFGATIHQPMIYADVIAKW